MNHLELLRSAEVIACLSAIDDGDSVALQVLADLLEESNIFVPYQNGGDSGWMRGGEEGVYDTNFNEQQFMIPPSLFDCLPRKTSASNQLFASRRSAYLNLALAVVESQE